MYDAVIDGRIVAGEDRVLACRRFARMATSGEYDIRTRDADFVIGVIEKDVQAQAGPEAGRDAA